MNNKGWLRIVEASISILIILSILFLLYNREARVEDLGLDERARTVLDELAFNSTFRNAVVNNDGAMVTQSVARAIPETSLRFEVRICELTEVCGKSNFTAGNIYAAERVISSSLDRAPVQGGANSKKVRLFIWRERDT